MNSDMKTVNMAPTARKSPTITISPSDFDTQVHTRSWWKRMMSRRSRNLVFLITLVSLGYFITGSRSRQDLQQYHVNKDIDVRPQPDVLSPMTHDAAPLSEPTESPISSSYLSDAISAVNPPPESAEVHSHSDDTVANGTIGMVTMLYGDPNPVYERALQSHMNHGKTHGYPVYVLRQKLLGRLWSKPAYILSIILEELQKPKEIRLKWLFWFDADTVLINPKIPLEIFLPPVPEFEHIHFLCGDDHNGLNDGAFLLRINDYSMHLMAAALTVESFRPEVNLRFSEQSAIEHVVKSEDIVRPWESFSYTDGYAKIPQRWMNAYMGPRSEEGILKPKKVIKGNSVKEGDMLVHFAGSGETKRRRMSIFMDALERNNNQWEIEPEATGYMTEISAFWQEWKLVEEKRHKEIEELVKKLEEEDAQMATESSAASSVAAHKTPTETATSKPEKKKSHSETSDQHKKHKQHSGSVAPTASQAAASTGHLHIAEDHDHDLIEDQDAEKHDHDHDMLSDDIEPSDDSAVGTAATEAALKHPSHSHSVELATSSHTATPVNKHTRREMLAGKIRRDMAKSERRSDVIPYLPPPSALDTGAGLRKRDTGVEAQVDKSKMMKRRIKRIL